MDAKTIIEIAGGRKAVIEMTGLTRGRISQWVVENRIPTPWMKFFEQKFPALRIPPSIQDRRHNPQTPQQKRETEAVGMRIGPNVEKLTT